MRLGGQSVTELRRTTFKERRLWEAEDVCILPSRETVRRLIADIERLEDRVKGLERHYCESRDLYQADIARLEAENDELGAQLSDKEDELERLRRIDNLYGPMQSKAYDWQEIAFERKDEIDRLKRLLPHLVDVVWGIAHEDESVPSSDWARRMIEKAEATLCARLCRCCGQEVCDDA